MTRVRKIALWTVLTVVMLIAVAVFLHRANQDLGIRKMMSEVILSGWGAQKQIETFYEKHKRLPHNAKEAELDLRGGRYIERMHYEAGRSEIHVVAQGLGPAVDGKSIVFQAQPRAGKIEWVCGSYDMPRKYLPKTCNWKP